jgi:ribosomal-protein-alanine N-acetyltransferase
MEHKGTLNIETKRLLLRRFVREDALPMYKTWATDSDVTRYLSWFPHENVEVTKNILNTWIEQYKSTEYYNWAVAIKDNKKLMGSISVVRQYKEHDVCEIGYCYGKEFWGKGYGTEALEGVIDFMINKVGFNRVHAYHHAENEASGKVMKKAGMKYEGRMREYHKDTRGVYVDCDMYAILRKDLE